MTADDVCGFLALMEAHGIRVWLDGGWAVDACLGSWTRRHCDLDIVIEERYVPVAVAALQRRGYAPVPRPDTRAWNFVLGDDTGRQIDVHVIVLDEHARGLYGPPENGKLSFPKSRPSRFACVFRTDQAIWPVMVRWLGILTGTLRSTVRTHRELALENLALRQQLAVWKARQPRPRLTALDRIFWVVLSRFWKRWRSSLQMVRPETVVGWHRQGFRRYWAWKSRRRRGRPTIRTELRDLIGRMSRANPLWGAPRIHGELLKLGLTVSQATVSKYMLRPRRPPSQAWRTFLKNHAKDLIALDFFTVPTATFRVLFVLVVLNHGRRRLVHFNVTEHPTADWTGRQLIEACGLEEAPRYLIRDRDQVYGERFSRQAKTLNIREAVIAPRSPWQNAYAERVIGSIRRECLDHLVVIGERHLPGILSKYVDYYNGTRTHLSLAKDAPAPRSVQPPSQGRVAEVPRVGGLHHEYLRRAA